MKVHEFQAKQLLRDTGVAVPRGKVAASPDEAEAAFGDWTVSWPSSKPRSTREDAARER